MRRVSTAIPRVVVSTAFLLVLSVGVAAAAQPQPLRSIRKVPRPSVIERFLAWALGNELVVPPAGS
jgi:hypothetical protein